MYIFPHLTFTLPLTFLRHIYAFACMPIYAGSCSLGAAAECFQIAVKYSKERSQFGKPIALNQK